MTKNPFDVLRAQETQENSQTYVDGIGFLPQTNRYATTLGIRRMSNLFCLSVLIYFALQNLLRLPITFIAHFIGADVQINHYTGLIVTTPLAKTLILLFSDISAFFIVLLVCGCVYNRSYRASGIFGRPHRGITTIALPIVMAVYLLGIFIGMLQGELVKSIGLIFPFSFRPFTADASISTLEIFGTLLFVLLQELFFRGIVLTPLRRYGDGFAIVAASIVAALWSGGFLELLPAFLLSIPLCYFTIRSGSVFTAIICRLSCECVVLLLRTATTLLESSLAWVIVLLVVLLVVFFAVFVFITFIRLDRSAFHLKRSKDNIKTSYKLWIFVSSIASVALIVFLLTKIIKVMQIIG